MRPWRASLPRSKQSGSMRLGSAPAQTRGRRCSSISRCSTIGSGCTQPWATALRLRRGPAWRRSPCALRRDILIYPLHTKRGGPTVTAGLRASGSTAPWLLDGAMNGPAFRTYVADVLAPTLRPGDTVVLDNLPAHKVSGVREHIEAVGARLLYLPPYSPDFNPIELAFAKLDLN